MKKILSKVLDGVMLVGASLLAFIVTVVIFIGSAAWVLGIPIIILLVIAKLLGWI